MKQKIPAVIFGDHIAAYGVIRALHPHNIPLYIVSQTGKGLSVASRYVKKSITLKSGSDAFFEKLIDWLYKEVGREAVFIIAGDDDYLDILAKYLQALPKGVRPTFPDACIVKLVREKRRSYGIAQELGICVPKTNFVTTRNELEELINRKNTIDFPVLMRPEKHSLPFALKYGKKAVICNNIDEVLSTYDSYAGFMGELLLQQLIPGGEHLLHNFIGVFNASSDPIAVFMNRKRRSSDKFSSCTLMESMWHDEVLDISIRLIKKMGYVGYANPEYKLDPRDGHLKLMEINGRVTLSNSHALRCGINLPLYMYTEVVEGPLNKKENFKQNYPDNVLWSDLLGDSMSALRLLIKKDLKLKEYLLSMRGSGYIFEPFNLLDPMPTMTNIKNRCTTLFTKTKG